MYYTEYPSTLGTMLLTRLDTGLTGIWMNRKLPENGILMDDHPIFCQTKQWLDGYFAGRTAMPQLPLELEGTPFQKTVWNRLRDIPWGSVVTYGHIAREMERLSGKRMSAQAVGSAVGRNPISILIPCHRVVGVNGKLTGYAGGLDKKAWLLRHEGWKGMEHHDHK